MTVQEELIDRPGPARQQVRVFHGDSLPDELIARWEQLWQAMPITQRTPFLHPTTTVIAASVLDTVRVAVITEGDTPVAFLPFEKRGRRGLPVADDISNGDGIVVQADIDLPVESLVRACGLRSLAWVHRDALPSPLSPYDHFVDMAAMVDVSGGEDAYIRAVTSTSSVLKQTARKRRKLHRERGPVTFQLAGDHGLARQLLAQKMANIRAAGDAPDFDLDRALRLIEAFGRHAEATPVDSLLSVLRVRDDVVAMNWGIAAGGRFVSSIPTFDNSLGQYSPGQILHVDMITQLAGTAVELVDLGLGIDQTKKRLMTHTTPMAGGVAHGSAAGRTYRRARTAVRRIVRGQ